LEALRGAAREDKAWGSLDLALNDVLYVRFMGGGGYGDPIERDPEQVLQDVMPGLVSVAAAHDIYCVVLNAIATAVDWAATRQRRLAIRRRRLGREIDQSFLDRRPPADTGRPINEYLQQADDGATQCTWCGHLVAPAGADWKDHAVIARRPLAKAGPHRTGQG